MNIKKLIASIAITFSALFSVGVAQAGPPQITNYDFTATLMNGDIITAQLTADSANSFIFQSSTLVDPFLVSNFKVNGVAASITTSYYDGAPVPNAYGWVNSGFLPSNAALDLIYSTGTGIFTRITPEQTNLFTFTNSGSGYYNTFTSEYNAQRGISGYFYPPATLSNVGFTPVIGGGGGGVAPEMNASFIPQVALMLACLFFLFGRKKETVEPMLIV